MADYQSYASSCITALQEWYHKIDGYWSYGSEIESTARWWNWANSLEAILDYSARTNSSDYEHVVALTFEKNRYGRSEFTFNSGGNFINDWYDDECWWALAYLKAYDLFGDERYFAVARNIFADMETGWDTICKGGLWWTKKRTYKNAIVNELFLMLAARLYQRTSHEHYLKWAEQTWDWLENSSMINEQHLVNDGLDSQTCANNGQTTWTYLQGVLAGGLVDLYKIKGGAYLHRAETIVEATINPNNGLVDPNGILREPCESSECDPDQPQFKGIFMRNLSYLYQVSPKDLYKTFMTRNADSIWLQNRNSANQCGLHWCGPVDKVDPTRQTAALEALVAAIPFSTT